MRRPRVHQCFAKGFYLQRNKFTRSFSLEAIQKTLIWRLANLWPTEPPSRIPNVHCLPTDIRDRFGRAVLVIETVPVDETMDSQKRSIILAFEQLRIHLRRLYDRSEDHRNPPLQYMVLLDLSQLSLQSLVSTCFTYCEGIPICLTLSRNHKNLDLFTWTVREIIPRFPGMLAGGEPSDLLFSDPHSRLLLHQSLCLTIHGRIPVSGLSSSQSKSPLSSIIPTKLIQPTGKYFPNPLFRGFSFRLIRNCWTILRLLLCRKVTMPSSVPHILAEPIIDHKIMAGIYPRCNYLRIQYVPTYHSL